MPHLLLLCSIPKARFWMLWGCFWNRGGCAPSLTGNGIGGPRAQMDRARADGCYVELSRKPGIAAYFHELHPPSSQILDFGAARKQRECCIFATSGYMGLYTPQIPMELESQARLANAALLANWDYENHCFGHLWDFGHRDVCKSLECP